MRYFCFLIAVLSAQQCLGELVAHWPLNEGQGTSFRDVAGGHDGFIPGGELPTWSADAAPTGFENPFALSFESLNQQYVTTDFEGIGGDGARTISAWVKSSSTSTQAIVGYGDTQTGAKWHFGLNGGDTGGDPPRVPGAPRTESSGGNLTGDVSIADGTWHHVVSVFPDGGLNEEVVHYVDGVAQGETGVTPNFVDTMIGGGLPTVSIGARQNAPPTYDSFFNGLIDDVRIYDRELSVAEITGLTQNPTATGLVAHWPFDDGPGSTTATDVAGNFDGTLSSAFSDVSVEWADDGPEGISNTSVRFTGDEGPSYIETPYEGVGGNDARTITMWVKADPQPTNTAMLAYGTLANGEKWHFRINQGTNSLRTEYQGGQNFAETDIADGEWHFVATVFPEGAEFGSEILHFLDGDYDEFAGGNDFEINTGTDQAAGAFPVHIGSAAGHPNRFFVGQIADVRFYDEELDQDALLEIMAGGGNQIPGDFDGDGELTAADIDRLTTAVIDGLTDTVFDVNGDGSVNNEDRNFWVRDLKNTYIGDANLDGEFSSTDFVFVFTEGEYEDGVPLNSTWGSGDWNGDGDFTSSDFVAAFSDGGFENGPRAAVVPEPTAAWLLLTATLVGLLRRKK